MTHLAALFASIMKIGAHVTLVTLKDPSGPRIGFNVDFQYLKYPIDRRDAQALLEEIRIHVPDGKTDVMLPRNIIPQELERVRLQAMEVDGAYILRTYWRGE